MQRFTSNLFEPPHDQRIGVSASRSHTSPTDGDGNESSLGRSQFEVVEGKAPKKNAAGQRLNGLASFRIHSTEIIFTSEGFHVSGGKADVVQATFRWDDGSDELVAVKKLRSHEGTSQKKFSNEFVHEVEVMAGLSHKNIARLVGFVEDLEKGNAWIILSWEPNGNVSEFLATGKYEIPERVSLIKDAFEGIKYLHTRQPPICHGDLKSLNILVSSSYRAIITDFGSARAITESEDIASHEEHDQQAQRNPTMEQAGPQLDVGAVGNQLTLTGPAWSLRWAPPEVVDGERPSLSTDIWAGGWICWEVMTDKVPFHEVNSAGAITLMVIQGDVPETREDAQLAQVIRLCSLMKDCWAFDPRARPNITRCCTDLRWIPSVPPSGGKASDRRIPSIELLLEMGLMHYEQDSLKKATSLFQEALSLARSAGNQAATAKALRSLGDVYRFQCKYAQAEESYSRAQELYVRIGDDWLRAYTLDGLGGVYSSQAKYIQAEESYGRAQEIFARVGNDHGRANTLLGLGDVYRCQSKYARAEQSYTRAQEIYSRVGDDRGRANTLLGLGVVYHPQCKYIQAEEMFTRAQETYTRIGDDLGQANTLDGLGDVYRLQSKYTQAEGSYTRAQEIYARIGDDRGRANALYGLGELYRVESKYTQAEERLTRAQEIYTRIGDDQGRANTSVGLGHVYRLQFKYTQADESYTRAEEIYARIGDDLGRANVQRGLGHLRWKQGRNAEAAILFTEAKDLYAQIGSTDDEEGAAHWLEVVSHKQDSSTP